jgi:HPt (histidine-containing phosphotransfer) domain-containing protein
MTEQARSEFFAREAGDYLRQLEPLIGGSVPSGETLVRLARALRGAAMLAGPRTFTDAARELEQLARLLRDGSRGWDEIAPAVRRAVEGLGRLVGVAAAWDEERDREAASLAEELRHAAGAPRAAAAPSPGDPREWRVFVAREAGAVAGAAELAARALAGAAAVPHQRLAAVSRAMRSLRGVADLTELAPLQELLDALDAAVTDLSASAAPPPGAADAFFAAAGAFARVARDISGVGRPDPALEEAGRFAELLHRMLAGPGAVVPVTDLLLEGVPDAVQPRGGHTPEPPDAAPADLSTLSERLLQGADQLRAAASPAARRLVAAQLLVTLRHAPGGLGTRQGGDEVRGLLEVLERPRAGDETSELVARLERTARRLVAGDEEPEPVPIETLLVEEADERDVVPIETLLAEPRPEPEPVPIESLAPDDLAAPDRTPLERSLSTYSRLVRADAPAPPLEAAGVVPVVPIEQLLYSGRGALLRAEEVRRELTLALGTAGGQLDRVEPLVRELLDLVPLAIAGDR